jgi:tetratricopeptide (TPR) repeat protein
MRRLKLRGCFDGNDPIRRAPSKEAYLKARAAALKGLDLDDTLADAHTTLGVVSLAYDWDWRAAEQSFKRALALVPDDARAHRRYALGLMWLGRFDEATHEMRRARDLAPVDLEVNASLALIPYFARRYDDAIAEARKSLKLNDSFSQAYRTIARALVEKAVVQRRGCRLRARDRSGRHSTSESRARTRIRDVRSPREGTSDPTRAARSGPSASTSRHLIWRS